MFRSAAAAEQVNSAEYRKSKSHNYVKSNQQRDVYMVFGAENKIRYSLKYQNRQVQVTLTFPEQTDTKAEQEFVSRLKTIYLEKIITGAWQTNDLALSSPTTEEKAGMEESHA